jgi:hypothetical protein
MVKEEGKYSHLWMKYAAVIHVLLKKTDVENQKLQLYKHEFDFSGVKKNANVSFSLNMVNGKVVNLINTAEIARDLWRVLDNNTSTKNWLKERSVKISIDKTYALQLEKLNTTLVDPSCN